MKAMIFIVTLMFSVTVSAQQQAGQLNEQQKDAIQKEVKAALDGIVDGFESLNAEEALGYYWDSPEFVAVNGDGSFADAQTNRKAATDLINSAESIKITTTHEDFSVMAADLVICAWGGKEEVTFKSGEKLLLEPIAETLVFKKISGGWKVIYDHESATTVPPDEESE